MKTQTGLPKVTWKEVYNGDGKTIPSVKVSIVKNTGVRKVENGTSKQVLGSSEEKK